MLFLSRTKKQLCPCSNQFHSIWICRINITIMIGKKMENYRLHKWILECTSQIIVLALGGKTCPSLLMWHFSPMRTDLRRQHRRVTWRLEIYAFALYSYLINSFRICLFNNHFLGAYSVPLCQALWIE